jgi:hypothetical protein
MASLRGLALAIVGGVAGTISVAALGVGCGGDDIGPSSTSADSGPDTTPDVAQTADVALLPDTGRDIGVDAGDGHAEAASEGGIGAEASVVSDSSDGGDAGRDADATIADGPMGHDADASTAADASDADGSLQRDADSSTAADSSDGATSDADGAAFDADGSSEADAADATDGDAEAGPNAAQQYLVQYAQALCDGFYTCCERYDSGIDNAQVAGCEDMVVSGNLAWETTLPSPGTFAAGKLDVSDAGAAACLGALPNLACGTFSASQYQTVTNDCLGVFVGTVALNAPGCIDSFECASGYCNLPTDGGAGTCSALVGAGGACVTQDMCSQASLAVTMYCTTQVTGNGTGTCQPLLADGANCGGADQACASGICGGNGGTTCGGSFVNPDVGDGGSCL